MLGSVDASYTNSPGSAETSTTLPWSTISMHCPSLTATMEPFEMTLSSAFRLPPNRRFMRFAALTASTSASNDSAWK